MAVAAGVGPGERPSSRSTMTVRGPVPADQLGFTLIHEHLLLDLMRLQQARAGAGQERMHYEDVLESCRRARTSDWLDLVGLHHHVGRWTNDPLLLRTVVREQVECSP